MKKDNYLQKYQKLKYEIEKMEKVAVAFSGGVDSAFLLKTSRDVLYNNVIAITVKTSTQFESDIINSTKIAKKLKVKQELIDVDILEDKQISRNSIDRCYHCKRKIFSEIKKVAEKKGFKNIMEGSNIDDTKKYRPGFKVIEELKIKSPLIDIGLKKDEVRKILRDEKLEFWDKPSQTCLLTRFPYNYKVTQTQIDKIKKAEKFLKEFGISQVRVRYHDKLVRIEVLKNEMDKISNNSNDIIKEFKKLGFKYMTLDMEGYRSGCFDQDLESWKKC